MIYKLLAFIFYLFILLLLLPLFILISLLILLIDGLPVIIWSKRVGKYNNLFYMPKFRTMKNDTPDLATHLLKNPEFYITKFGKFLRSTSLDEIPQFWTCLFGKMKLIGPRPALHNQHDLIKLRKINGIDKMTPGITGYAQIKGRDSISIEKKIDLEIFYKNNKNFYLDIIIILNTVTKSFFKHNISH